MNNDIVSVDELLAMGYVEIKTKFGRRSYKQAEKFVAIECTKCNYIKYINEFPSEKKGYGGVMSHCKLCLNGKVCEKLTISRQALQKYIDNNPLESAFRLNLISRGYMEFKTTNGRTYFKSNSIFIALQCTECKRIKYLGDFHKNLQTLAGVESKCKECRFEYRKQNKAKIAAYSLKHHIENPIQKIINRHRRRARLKVLPHDLTNKQLKQINNYFDNSCSLTGKYCDLQMDHVIPISIGHGGTTFSNMVPLSGELNRSKHAHNLFTWFNENKTRFNLEQSKFDALVSYLADINGMTEEEYQSYVTWCHENPREIELDEQQSLDLIF